MMKKFIFWAILPLLAISCEENPDFDKIDGNMTVYTKANEHVNLQGLNTYYLPDSILEAGSHKATYWKDENAQKIISQIADNMNAKGYERITDPAQKDKADLGLQVSYAEKNTQVLGYGYGWWDYDYWGPWWGGWYYPYPVVYNYNTNNLVMELVDLKTWNDHKTRATEKLPIVWYGNLSGFVYPNNYSNMSRLLNGIDQAFAQSAFLDKKQGN